MPVAFSEGGKAHRYFLEVQYYNCSATPQLGKYTDCLEIFICDVLE